MMSDAAIVEGDHTLLDEEALLSKHRRERKELQAKVQALKKTATKGDKKKKKEVTEEIAKLEADLDKQHEAELLAFKEKQNVQAVDNVAEKLSEVAVDEADPNDGKERVTRAQKRREKKTNKQKEREKLLEEQEIENLQGNRNLEIQAFSDILSKRGLELHEVPSDGNCMYVALQFQLGNQGDKYSVKQLREITSHFLLNNREEFEPFWENESGTDNFDSYCKKIETTAEWGGNLELRALSQALKRPIEILVAGSSPILIGEEFVASNAPLILTYHRHMFGLGEHYNSVKSKTVDHIKADGFM